MKRTLLRGRVKSSWSSITQQSRGSDEQRHFSPWTRLLHNHSGHFERFCEGSTTRMPTALVFPKRASNPKTKTAELPLIRKRYKCLFPTPLLTEFVSCLSRDRRNLLPRHVQQAFPGLRCCRVVRCSHLRGELWASLLGGTVWNKVNPATARSGSLRQPPSPSERGRSSPRLPPPTGESAWYEGVH